MFTFGTVPSPKASINEATSKATKIHSTEECTRHITCDAAMKLRHEAICPANCANCIQAAAITENLRESALTCCDSYSGLTCCDAHNLPMLLPYFPTSPF